ncbi:ABC transporter transmembrane domain-containing protein [Ramlibacter rhizophilus]|uniref:ABC transmembrane type-1 domain-containing protein n=1 Tax=Ramlibacter rhizophilus TaxID=1781167 RepID=A0A4Z0BTD3_9BURK|nr:ABC transporter transmembrane domain-containing protein [Ramlibacter rhizophilus]TFZ01285.1 hypothetical protein EZ242_07840 [Ramlibacter rhizophilus]
MTAEELSARQLVWALGSCCAMAGKPYDPELVLRQHPPPCKVATLVTAARSLGFAAHLQTVKPRRLAAGPGQVLLVMRGREGGVQLGVLVAVTHTGVTWIPACEHEPRCDDPKAFAARFTGLVVHLKAQLDAPPDADDAAPVRRFGFRWFAPELLRHRKVWRDVLAASLVLQLLALGLPLFTQAIVDKVVVHQTESTLIAIAVGMAIFVVASAVLGWVRQYLVLHTGNRVDAVLAATVFQHLFRLPLRYFQHRPTGVVAARLQGVETIREFVSSAAVTLVLDIPFLLIAVAVMLHYSVALTFIALGVLAVIALLSALVAPVFQRRLNEQFLLGARNQAFLTEYIAGYETVKSLQLEPQLQKRYGDFLASYLQSSFRTQQIGNTYVVDSAGDEVVELDGEGEDTVWSSVDHSLARNVENLVLTGSATAATGNALDNRLTGNAGANALDGGAGGDVMAGDEGNDTYVVDDARDLVIEWSNQGLDEVLAGIDYVLPAHVENLRLTGTANITGRGNELDNFLFGNSGNNLLDAGAGDDTYHHEIGGGLDTVSDSSGTDTIRFGAGLTLERVSLRIVTHGREAIAQVRILDEAGQEQPGQGIDFAMEVDALGRLSAPIERFAFEGGSVHTWDELLVPSTPLVGSARADRLLGGRGDERMDGGAGDDVLYGGSGRDTLHGAAGNDVLFGGRGNDVLWGGTGADLLYGHHGDDQLHGEDGDDYLLDRSGNNLFSGGYGRDIAQAGPGADRLDLGAQADLADAGGGDDVILARSGDDWVAAGRGNDLIDLGSGCNLLAFNRGDGADVLTGGGRDTLSLGAGIRLADLSLARSGHDLVLGLGEGDSLTLRDWYCGSAWQTVERLQVLTDPADRDPAGQDRLRNHAVEVFDFGRLVRSFDRARAADLGRAGGYGGYDGYGGHGGQPAVTDAAAGWAAMNSLLDAHLGGSDSAAYGGDLSAQYHARGSLSGLDLGAAQRVLAQGGADWQALRPRSELAQGALVTLA